jgi:hypothetical protein
MAYEWMFNGVNTYHQGNMGAMKPPAGNSQAKPAGVVTNRPDNAPVEAAGRDGNDRCPATGIEGFESHVSGLYQ